MRVVSGMWVLFQYTSLVPGPSWACVIWTRSIVLDTYGIISPPSSQAEEL